MATRLYHSTQNPAAGPSWTASGSWENTSQAGGRRDLLTAKANQATGAGSSVAGNGSNPNDVYMQGFVSPPLAGAQTISGTVKGQMFARGASNNFRAQLILRVVSRDGTTVRGTLVDQSTGAESSTWSTTAAVNRKFPLSAISPVTVTTVNAQDGDRIVAEYGARVHNTTTTSTNNFLRWCNPTSSDLAEDETSTDNGARASWLEFSANLVFGNLGGNLALTATFSAAGKKAASGAGGALALTATFARAGAKQGAATGALTLSPTFARAGKKATTGASGALSTSASLSSAGARGVSASGSLSASASLTSAGAKATTAAGALSASASMARAGEKEAQGSGALAMTASFAGAGSGSEAGSGNVALSGILAGAGSKATSGAGSLTLTLTLIAAGVAVGGQRPPRPSYRFAPLERGIIRRRGKGQLTLAANMTAQGGITGASGDGRLSLSWAGQATAAMAVSGSGSLRLRAALQAEGEGQGETVRALRAELAALRRERDDLEALLAAGAFG